MGEKTVKCKICGKKLGRMTSSHLKKHRLTVKEYKKQYPGAKTFPEELRKIVSEKVKEFHRELRKDPKKYAKRRLKLSEKVKKWNQNHPRKKRGINKKCKTCGKTFYIYPHKIKEAKYCSLKCRSLQVKKTCEKCGKKFYVPPSRTKAKYCSPLCFHAACKKYKKPLKPWKERDPEGYRQHQIKAAKIGHKKWRERDPDGYRAAHVRSIKIGHKKWRERDPVGYKQHKVRIGKLANKKWRERDPDGYHATRVRIGKLGGPKSAEAWRKGKPYVWRGVHFDSKSEREVAEKLLKKPVEGVNTQVKIGSKTIDFFLEGKLFVEYHPWERKITQEEYKKQRLEAIAKSKYKGTPLIIIKNIKEVEKVKDILKKLKK